MPAGASKADIYEAALAAIEASGMGGPAAVYVDGRALSSSLARHMGAELGRLQERRAR